MAKAQDEMVAVSLNFGRYVPIVRSPAWAARINQTKEGVPSASSIMYVHSRTNKMFHVEHISTLHAC